ncbi:hypothetical protein HHL28_02060 [Aerophototrophica crusticola]|uniref:Uncharacterized protein n=1 Tax=Aerophototrophica crusticola TaxID=1709002 RepID=A0A858R3U5_9PROT|nr:hypothetical protein HHL28_02060 [Rhodospirillaceae bacterium B3]
MRLELLSKSAIGKLFAVTERVSAQRPDWWRATPLDTGKDDYQTSAVIVELSKAAKVRVGSGGAADGVLSLPGGQSNRSLSSSAMQLDGATGDLLSVSSSGTLFGHRSNYAVSKFRGQATGEVTLSAAGVGGGATAFARATVTSGSEMTVQSDGGVSNGGYPDRQATWASVGIQTGASADVVGVTLGNNLATAGSGVVSKSVASIDTGNGGDTVNVDMRMAQDGEARIWTGDGVDTVTINRSAYGGLVGVSTGAGDDVIRFTGGREVTRPLPADANKADPADWDTWIDAGDGDDRIELAAGNYGVRLGFNGGHDTIDLGKAGEAGTVLTISTNFYNDPHLRVERDGNSLRIITQATSSVTITNIGAEDRIMLDNGPHGGRTWLYGAPPADPRGATTDVQA